MAAQLIKYGVIASIGLGFDFGWVIFCKEILGIYYLVSVFIGFMVGLILTFFLSNRYVFGESKLGTKALFVLFGIIGIVGLVILEILVWLLTDKFGINYIASKAIATIFVFLWNFFARKNLYHDD